MGGEFVLVHGMSHGAWAWESVARRLERDGHRVVAMDLPGHGRRAHERACASVDGYARAVADAMMKAGVARGIVVGHSMGGVVIPKVAELVPARVAHLVFLAAVVLADGESMLGAQIPPPARPLLEGLARSGGGAVQYPASVEAARWLNRCLRDAAVPPARAAQYAARLGVAPVDIDCAHEPMFSALDDLVRILEAIAAGQGDPR